MNVKEDIMNIRMKRSAEVNPFNLNHIIIVQIKKNAMMIADHACWNHPTAFHATQIRQIES